MKAIILLLCSGITAFAGCDSVPQKYVDTVASEWQHKLRLDDYRISVHIVRLSELRENTLGNSRRDEEYKTVFISVLNPCDYPGYNGKKGKAILQDIKDTIVHELVHVRLAILTDTIPDSAVSKEAEVVVVRITAALLGEKVLP